MNLLICSYEVHCRRLQYETDQDVVHAPATVVNYVFHPLDITLPSVILFLLMLDIKVERMEILPQDCERELISYDQ
jgi:hypothetical protein